MFNCRHRKIREKRKNGNEHAKQSREKKSGESADDEEEGRYNTVNQRIDGKSITDHLRVFIAGNPITNGKIDFRDSGNRIIKDTVDLGQGFIKKGNSARNGGEKGYNHSRAVKSDLCH